MSMMCPACRHVVDDESLRHNRCGNCNAPLPKPTGRLQAKGSSGAQAPDEDQPPRVPASKQPETHQAPTSVARSVNQEAGTPPPPPESERKSEFDPASTTSLICAGLFFVPIVTQAIGIIAGSISIARARRARKPVHFGAVLGLAFSIAALIGWALIFRTINIGGRAMITVGPAVSFPTSPEEDDEATRVADDAITMERVGAAATSYKRDFGHWPASIDDLKKSILPPSFELPETVVWLSVDPAESDLTRPLLVRSPSRWDKNGDKLASPQWMVQPLVGEIRYESVDPTPP
ncbi:MAG: hypothetical protein ACPGXK_13860 [Phycisphaerae bacterium]